MKAVAQTAFLAAVLGFGLPFFDVIHRGQSVIRFSGQELVMGTTFHRPLPIGSTTVDLGHVPPLPAAGISLAALALAAIVGSMRPRVCALAAVGLGGIGAVSLLVLRSQVGSRIAPGLAGTAIRYTGPYWLVLCLACAATLLAGISATARARTP
jgi:hypothetical protein